MDINVNDHLIKAARFEDQAKKAHKLANGRPYMPYAALQAARHYQRAYAVPLRAGLSEFISLPAGRQKTWMRYLAGNVYQTSIGLIASPNLAHKDAQLRGAIHGLTLIASGETTLFLSNSGLRPCIGNALGELRAYNPDYARICLQAFDEQCRSITPPSPAKDHIQNWIRTEMDLMDGITYAEQSAFNQLPIDPDVLKLQGIRPTLPAQSAASKPALPR